MRGLVRRSAGLDQPVKGDRDNYNAPANADQASKQSGAGARNHAQKHQPKGAHGALIRRGVTFTHPLGIGSRAGARAWGSPCLVLRKPRIRPIRVVSTARPATRLTSEPEIILVSPRFASAAG